MKTSICLLIAAACSLAYVSQATVRTVSSNPSTIAQFSNIQDAVDASANGDTVYVYGSPNIYAAFMIMDKKVSVIGPGWSPDKNLPHQAMVNGFSIRNSAAGGTPDGSEVQGLVLTNTSFPSRSISGDLPVNNIRLIRCQFSGALQWDLSSTGFLLEGNTFYNALLFSTAQTYQSFIFQNNIFFHQICCVSNMIIGLTNSVNVIFDHNLFTSTNASAGTSAVMFSTSRFISFTNNIFNQSNVGIGVSFSTFTNNITNNISLNSANAVSNATPWAVNNNVDGLGNVSNQSPAMASQTAVNNGSNDALLDFTIASGPANNAGTDGKDLGLLFDSVGSLNWTNSRNSRIPRIFSMNITNPSVAPGGTLQVTVQARTSN